MLFSAFNMNYLFLFFDSFTSALILPIRSEAAVYAMFIFKKYNPHLIFVITLSASVCGSLVNWFLGKKLQFLKKTEALKNKNVEMKNAEEKWNKYVIWLLIFSPLKILGNPLSLLAGFLNTSFKKFFCLILMSKFIYYFWLIYFSNL
jgi:membrane protein YqaA with SNARE-associated domain